MQLVSGTVQLYSPGVTFADLFQRWLEATGKTQVSVSAKSGISTSKLSPLATGANPNPEWDTIEKVARGFEISTEEFLAGPRPGVGATRDDRREGASVLEKLVSDASAKDGSWQSSVAEAIAVLTAALKRDSDRRAREEETGAPGRGATSTR